MGESSGEVGRDVLVKKSGQPQVTRRGLFWIVTHPAVKAVAKAPEKPPPVKAPTEPKPDGLTRRELFELTAGSGAASLIASSLFFGIKPWELFAVSRAAGKTPIELLPPPPMPKKEELPPPGPDASSLVFGSLPPAEKNAAKRQVEAMRNLLINHSSYNKLLEVTTKWEGLIRQEARRVGFSEELTLGIVFIENGGGEDLKSSVGARGVAQLMPETARRYGLRVNTQVDERANPAESIAVMCSYLKDNLDRFAGNLGLTVWSYHAGEGNVYNALREYFLSVGEKDPGDIVGAKTDQEAVGIMENYRRLIGQKKVNVHQVLSNPRVQKNVLSHLEDETELYAYKAVAAAEIFEEAKQNHSSPRS